MEKENKRFANEQLNACFEKLPPAVKENILQSGVEITSEAQLRSIVEGLTGDSGAHR